MDDAIVGDADLGVNFFLDESSRGKPRAQCTTELLLELNPEVSGDWFPKSEVRQAISVRLIRHFLTDLGIL